jgi:L-lactate dehydrogenase complex protein LldG
VADARAEVLARIRAALGEQRSAPPVPRDYRRAGEHPPGHPVLLDLLVERLVDYRAKVVETTEAELPAALARAVADTLPPGGRLVAPAGLPAEWVPAEATTDDGRLGIAEVEAFDGVLTGCAAAVAETGTIVLDGSAGQGRRLVTLLPDRHLCVVRAEQVVQTVPELLERLDPRRPLTFISGPSATSDIELDRVEGVHGPRTLVVVLARPQA